MEYNENSDNVQYYLNSCNIFKYFYYMYFLNLACGLRSVRFDNYSVGIKHNRHKLIPVNYKIL